MSDEKRNEGQLLADVFGLESLADDITCKLVSEAPDQPTASAILGPFWRADAPLREMGESIVLKDVPSGYYTKMHGVVVDFRTGEPVSGAILDVWLTAPNGMYEQQDPDQPDMNLRGRFKTSEDGRYEFYSLRPTAYPIPDDGPTGKLLKLLDRHPWRPGHTHFIVSVSPRWRASLP
jgi:catechol 1,2-dioxygenase